MHEVGDPQQLPAELATRVQDLEILRRESLALQQRHRQRVTSASIMVVEVVGAIAIGPASPTFGSSSVTSAAAASVLPAPAVMAISGIDRTAGIG